MKCHRHGCGDIPVSLCATCRVPVSPLLQLKLPQIQKIMMEFEKQAEIMDMKEELMNDAIDDAMGDEDDEEERWGRVGDVGVTENGISGTWRGCWGRGDRDLGDVEGTSWLLWRQGFGGRAGGHWGRGDGDLGYVEGDIGVVETGIWGTRRWGFVGRRGDIRVMETGIWGTWRGHGGRTEIWGTRRTGRQGHGGGGDDAGAEDMGGTRGDSWGGLGTWRGHSGGRGGADMECWEG